MLRLPEQGEKTLLALNKAFLYLNCQPRIFRKVPQASLRVCTKNYAPVYKHGWMQETPACRAQGPLDLLDPLDPRAPHSTSVHPAAPSAWEGDRSTGRVERAPPGIPEPQGRGRKAPQGFRRQGALPPLLSRPDGRVGENREEPPGRTVRNLGASLGSLLNDLKARFTGQEPGVLSPRVPLQAQDVVSAQDLVSPDARPGR